MIGRYFVTRTQEYPSILSELGFVSNESDYYKLIKSSYQRDIAEAIADSIASYLYGVGKNGNYRYGTQSTNGESSYDEPEEPSSVPEFEESESSSYLPEDESSSESESESSSDASSEESSAEIGNIFG